MKVLFWTPIFWPDIGGIETISMRHVQSLKERGHDCVVLASHGRVSAPKESLFGGIPVHRFPIAAAFQNKDLRQMMAIQNKIADIRRFFGPDLEHLNFGGPAPIGYFYLRAAGTAPAPLLVALHGSVQGLKGGMDTLTGRLLRAAFWTTACSMAVLDDARQVVPDIAERSSVIYYGLQEPEFAPAPLPFDEPCLLCLGRLVPEKGFDLAIQAFAGLADSHPRSRLVIAGDGPERSALENQAASLHLAHRIEFAGAIDPQDVYALLNKATIIIVPSRWREAFGLVATEAAQTARPVVATRVGGLSEAIIDGQTGLLVSKDDSHGLAGAIAYLLNHPAVAIQMGRDGRARVQSQFTWQRYMDEYEALYQKQISGAANC